MQHGVVAYGTFSANGKREAGICMKRAIVLNVCSFTHLNPFIVAAKHSPKPNARSNLDANFSDYNCRVRHIAVINVRHIRLLPPETEYRHRTALDCGLS